MSFINWSFITDFGDSAVTVPIALAVAAWLLASHAWRGAALWFLLFGAGALSVFCTKVTYAGWDIGVPQIDFTGVSGSLQPPCSPSPVIFWAAVFPNLQKILEDVWAILRASS